MPTIKEIIDYFTAKDANLILGDEKYWQQSISLPRSALDSNESHITFISKKLASEFDSIIQSTQSLIIIVDEDLIELGNTTSLPNEITFVLSKNAKKDLFDCASNFFNIDNKVSETHIEPSAKIDKNVVIGSKIFIGANVVIEENVKIGNQCTIGAGTVIKRNTTIGDKVIIGSCNVIGGDGFGYIKDQDTGKYELFPHYGGVCIKDEVHVGNNTCIDRGSLKDTVIGEGVKIDNLVHIAHNVSIGKNSLIIACSMIAGSVTIGENCWVAPSSSIRNAIAIGKNTTIGLASTVVKDVQDNETVMGNPAILKDDFMRLRKFQKTMMDHQEELKLKITKNKRH